MGLMDWNEDEYLKYIGELYELPDGTQLIVPDNIWEIIDYLLEPRLEEGDIESYEYDEEGDEVIVEYVNGETKVYTYWDLAEWYKDEVYKAYLRGDFDPDAP